MNTVSLGGPKELDDAFNLRRQNPQKALEINESYLRNHPDDPDGLFSRFQTLVDLGEYDKALDDINRVVEIEPNAGGYSARGHFFHETGNYERAVEDLTRSKELDNYGWATSLDPHFRADCYARMGRLEEALADCAFIPDDHRMPAVFGLPGGDKQQFIAEIKRRAQAARGQNMGT